MTLLQRHYDQKHNTVLQHIVDFISTHIPCGFVILADLPTKASIRPPFLLFDLRPDLIVWNQESGVAYLLELIVCFECNSFTSAEQKVLKCTELVEVINSTTPYKCHLHTVQIGSHGMTHLDSLSSIKFILSVQRSIMFYISLSICALTESLKMSTPDPRMARSGVRRGKMLSTSRVNLIHVKV